LSNNSSAKILNQINDKINEHQDNESDASLQRIDSITLSEIGQDSPLQNILDTGRLSKKFKDIDLIGQGGFGKVYRAIYHVDQKMYAIKVVRLHIRKSN
jgi:hypothetical protein